MFVKALMYASIFSPLVGIGLGLNRRRSLDRGLRLVLVLMIFSFISDAVMLWLAKSGIRNLPVAHVYGFAEAFILLTFFRIELPKYDSFLRILVVIYAAFYLTDSFVMEGLSKFNAYSRSLEALLMIILSVLFLYQLYTEEYDIFIDKSPDFWIVVGIMFYFSGAFFSFLLSTDILSHSPERFYGSWILHNCSNLTKNAIFAIGLWRVKLN